jgi:proteasome beta subunit
MENELKKHVRKTGTTTVGITTKEGIVLAADKRGTYGGDGGVSYIAGTSEQKIEKVNNEIVVTIAGVASELQKVIKLTRAELKLKELRDKKKPSIKEAAGLFSSIVYQNVRQFSTIPGITHFLLSGYDSEGSYLYDIHPDGYIQKIENYSASGSGMMQVNPILDSEYKENLTLKEGIDLATKAVIAAMKRDPASGEGVDVFTITKEGIKQVAKKKVETTFVEQ